MHWSNKEGKNDSSWTKGGCNCPEKHVGMAINLVGVLSSFLSSWLSTTFNSSKQIAQPTLQQSASLEAEDFSLKNIKFGLYLIFETEQRLQTTLLQKLSRNSNFETKVYHYRPNFETNVYWSLLESGPIGLH